MKLLRKTRSLQHKVPFIKAGETFWLSVKFDAHVPRIKQLGFSIPPVDRESLLPAGDFGAASKKNTEGWVVKHRDQPMETAYRQQEWYWRQFKGRGEYEEMSKIVDVPYQRYPRTHMAPHSVEFSVTLNGVPRIVAGPFVLGAPHDARATNTANVFVEIFGECDVLREDLSDLLRTPVRHLNWVLLPPGQNPWAAAKPAVDEIVARAKAGNRPVIQARFEAVASYGPEYVGRGVHGFDGYLAFVFPKARICLLESRSVNSATYVLPFDNWEALSSLSKAKLLDGNLHLARLIHREGWFGELAKLFPAKKKAA